MGAKACELKEHTVKPCTNPDAQSADGANMVSCMFFQSSGPAPAHAFSAVCDYSSLTLYTGRCDTCNKVLLE